MSVPRNSVVFLRSTFAWTVITERVHFFADRIDRHLVRQPRELDSEPSDRNERLNQVVMRVAVSFQGRVFKIEWMMPLIRGSPLIEAIAHGARRVGLFTQFELIGTFRNVAVFVGLAGKPIRTRTQIPAHLTLDCGFRVIVVEGLDVRNLFEVRRTCDGFRYFACVWFRIIERGDSRFWRLNLSRFA